MNYAKTMQKGFTLVEILIAIAIVGILMAIAVPGFFAYLERARYRATESTLKTIQLAINAFNADTNKFPSRLRDLVVRPSDPKIAKKWQQPYLEEEPEDGWGNELGYRYPTSSGSAHPYELYSFGPKGPGSSPEEWISVWKS